MNIVRHIIVKSYVKKEDRYIYAYLTNIKTKCGKVIEFYDNEKDLPECKRCFVFSAYSEKQ